MSTGPINPFTGEPQQLTPEQLQANDPAFRKAHPQQAALQSYYGPLRESDSMPYKLGEGMRNFALAPNALGSLLNRGPITGGVTLGAAGALGGGVIGAITDALRGSEGTAARLATILGISGLGVGALSGHMRQKEAGWRNNFGGGGSSRDALVDALNADQSINFQMKMQALAAIPRLSDADARRLSEMIGRLTGFGAGAAIMRFLMGAGLIGTLAGGVLGGMMGGAIGSRSGNGPSGMPSMSGFDFNGQRLF